MSLTYEKWNEIYTAKNGSYEKDYLINSARDLIQCQQIEIDILIRKKESVRNDYKCKEALAHPPSCATIC